MNHCKSCILVENINNSSGDKTCMAPLAQKSLSCLVAYIPCFKSLLKCFKHLTISFEWRCIGHDSQRAVDVWHKIAVVRWAPIFGILHKDKMKVELTAARTSECRLSYFSRDNDLCKTHLQAMTSSFGPSRLSKRLVLECSNLVDDEVGRTHVQLGGLGSRGHCSTLMQDKDKWPVCNMKKGCERLSLDSLSSCASQQAVVAGSRLKRDKAVSHKDVAGTACMEARTPSFQLEYLFAISSINDENRDTMDAHVDPSRLSITRTKRD